MRAGVLLVPALAATSVAALPQTGSSKIAGIDLGAIFDPPSWWWLPNILKARLTSKAYQKVITTNGKSFQHLPVVHLLNLSLLCRSPPAL